MSIATRLWGYPQGHCVRFFTRIRSLQTFTNATAKHAIVYHEDFKINPIPSNHRFPMPKDALLYERLEQLNLGRTFTPVPPDIETLCLVHDAAYVQSFLDGTVSDAAMRSIGLPWSKDLVTRTLIGTGSAILAARLALDVGIAVMCNGGTHHAHRDHGSGWCIFNDQAVAARSVQRDCNVGKILFIDLDVHQGDGTAAIFQNDDSVFTFSMHCEAQPYPSILQKSDLDVPLPAGCDDKLYLETLKGILPGLLEKVQPEMVMYNAGTDVHTDDSLGKMALSNDGILARDRLVMKLCSEAGTVVAAAIGGGYEPDHEKIVERHVMLHRAAEEYADAFLLNTRRARKMKLKE
jgi:acetoin utilization deacetylase AcuC-like enzyme